MDHITKSWCGKTIRFRESDGYGCLTDMAKATGKNVADWQRLKGTQEYLDSLSNVTGIPIGLLLETINEGNLEQMGTWGERKVCIRFAQWCSSDFAVQVDVWVEELITKKYVSLKPMSPDEAIIQSLQLWRKQQEEIVELQLAKQEHDIKIAVALAIAEQNQLAIANTDEKVNQQQQAIVQQQQAITTLSASVEALRQLINQPIPTCAQTTRQRIVEISQITGTVLFEKGLKPTIQEAMREVWRRLILKIKHSAARRDLANLKARLERQYETDLASYNANGSLGIKPLKKNYKFTYAQLIEREHIEQEALLCMNAVAAELI